MLWAEFEERVVNLDSAVEVAEIKKFLERFELSFDGKIEYTVALFNNGNIVATGSLSGEVLRNIAIDEQYQGEGLTGAIVSHLIQEAGRQGKFHYFIFTKPETAHLFTALGFKEIIRISGYASLLESGLGTIDSYCRELRKEVSGLPEGPRAAIVVNCNPFTLGHKAIITRAAEHNKSVIVFVLSEDLSLFPFDVRIRLVREGLAEYDNVRVLPGSKYIISAATFPAYFTKGEAAITAQTLLDANIFAKYIAPALGATCRYVGEEPYCAVTNFYNQALVDVLPRHGISVYVMPRIGLHGEIVSASKVREYIRTDQWDKIRDMVPETTYRYLRSEEAGSIIAKIKNIQSRH